MHEQDAVSGMTRVGFTGSLLSISRLPVSMLRATEVSGGA
jgi:hypothetical protein